VEKCGTARQPTDDSVIWRMRFTGFNNEGHRHTLTICNTYSFSTATMVARTRLNVTSYLQCVSGSFYGVCYSSETMSTNYPV